MSVVMEQETYNMSDAMTLPDIPDLSDLDSGAASGPTWENGYYEGQILAERRFVDKNGNERVFESSDSVSQKGDSRNIRLQLRLTRKSDGREMFTSTLINYRPEDLQADVVKAVIADNVKPREEQDASLTRARMTLIRLASIQRVAGVRQFQASPEGGLDLTPLYGKTVWVRLGDDPESRFKEVKGLRADKPSKAPTF